MLTDAIPAPPMAEQPKPKEVPVTPAASGLKGKIKEFCYQSFYRLFYGAERLLGLRAVYLFMWPIALLDLARRWSQVPQFDRLRRLAPESFWQGVSASRHYRKMIFDWYEFIGFALTYGLPGRPYWRKRFTVRGRTPFDKPDWDERPIILAIMHIGFFGLIGSWLRANGIKGTMFVAGMPPLLAHPGYTDRAKIADKVYGTDDIPSHFFSTSLRDILRFLKPGRVLAMALDGGNVSPDSDRQETGDFPIFVKQGVCRIGARVNARIYPVSLKRIGFCRYEVRFGRPVPDELLQKDDAAAATQHLVTEMWRDIRANPDDLLWSVLEAFPPTFEERQRVVEERPRTWP